MRAVLRISSRGKGAFALRKGLKVMKGTNLDLHRFAENEHGEFRRYQID
jgi:hypothetical protein